MAPPKDIYADLKKRDVIPKIQISSLAKNDDEPELEVLLQDVKAVSSYNWLSEEEVDSAVPTIQVPGAPPLVSFPIGVANLQLKPDSGYHYIDQNAARMKGRSGMIPGIAACYAYDKNFRIEDYDVITDRNNLLKLFELVHESENPSDTMPSSSPPSSFPWRGSAASGRWPSSPRGRGFRGRGGPGAPRRSSSSSSADGSASPRSPTSPRSPVTPRRGGGIPSMDRRPTTTRIDIDLVTGYNSFTGEYLYDPTASHQTLVLTRWEPKSEEIIFSSIDFRGFGFSFLTKTRQFLGAEGDEVVEKGPLDVTGYHCLVEYKLFGLRVLVRYHADGCDMKRPEFVKWIAKDAIRKLDENNQAHKKDSEQEESGEDTFDLLESFKTLAIKTGNCEEEEEKRLLKESSAHREFKLDTLSALDVIQTPNHIFPHDRIMQVKTRGMKAGLDREALYTQLFFSQTRHVFVAYHIRGNFAREDVQRESVVEGVSKWSEDNKHLLKKLTVLLKQIKDLAIQNSSRGAIVFKHTARGNNEYLEVALYERN